MRSFITLALLCMASICLAASALKREYYEIKIYTVNSTDQENRLDNYLRNAYIPALHRLGIVRIGVFKPVESDTTYFGKRIYVLTPFASLEQFTSLYDNLAKDKSYATSGKDYIDATFDNPPYVRVESIVLQAFKDMPIGQTPSLDTKPGERIYELRSYEGYTEKIYRNKVKMFNEGGEISLFKRLQFNAVFYAEVLVGSRMPNLMYMTSFRNMESRDAHWKAFSSDPEWKTLSAMAEYQKNVSKINIYLLHSTDYSDL